MAVRPTARPSAATLVAARSDLLSLKEAAWIVPSTAGVQLTGPC